jgi:hypothetical protein
VGGIGSDGDGGIRTTMGWDREYSVGLIRGLKLFFSSLGSVSGSGLVLIISNEQ